MKKIILSIGLSILSLLSICQIPSFHWAKSIGGANDDFGHSICTDFLGNVYTCGSFYGVVDFDPGPATCTMASSSGSNSFITKLDGSGNFLWAKVLGGAGNLWCLSIQTDFIGNVYTTGYFSGTADFDPGPGTQILPSNGLVDFFISKLDQNGNYLWAKSIGGIYDDKAFSLTTDQLGNVYTTGSFQDTVDFDPNSSVYKLYSENTSVFILKINSRGDFEWAKELICSGEANGAGVARSMDSKYVYVTGNFNDSLDCDPGAGLSYLLASGLDIFIEKLDSSGTLIWAKDIGGSDVNYVYSIAVDTAQNVLTTGYFYGTTDFDPGTAQYTLNPPGFYNNFISKLDSSGTFVWAKCFSGTESLIGQSIATDITGNVYTTGWFFGTADFDPGNNAYNLSVVTPSYANIYISKLSPSGNFIWAIRAGGNDYNWATSLALDPSANIYTTGRFQGTSDFDHGLGTCYLTSNAYSDVFIQKLGPSVPTDLLAPATSENIWFYPNPVTDLLQIHYNSALYNTVYNIKIEDALGKTILSSKYNIATPLLLDVHYFPPGVYFLKTETESHRFNNKFIKQ